MKQGSKNDKNVENIEKNETMALIKFQKGFEKNQKSSNQKIRIDKEENI